MVPYWYCEWCSIGTVSGALLVLCVVLYSAQVLWSCEWCSILPRFSGPVTRNITISWYLSALSRTRKEKNTDKSRVSNGIRIFYTELNTVINGIRILPLYIVILGSFSGIPGCFYGTSGIIYNGIPV